MTIKWPCRRGPGNRSAPMTGSSQKRKGKSWCRWQTVERWRSWPRWPFLLLCFSNTGNMRLLKRLRKLWKSGGTELWYHTSWNFFTEVFGNAAGIFEQWRRWTVCVQLELLGKLDSWNPAIYWHKASLFNISCSLCWSVRVHMSPSFCTRGGKRKIKRNITPKRLFRDLVFPFLTH